MYLSNSLNTSTKWLKALELGRGGGGGNNGSIQFEESGAAGDFKSRLVD